MRNYKKIVIIDTIDGGVHILPFDPNMFDVENEGIYDFYDAVNEEFNLSLEVDNSLWFIMDNPAKINIY